MNDAHAQAWCQTLNLRGRTETARNGRSMSIALAEARDLPADPVRTDEGPQVKCLTPSLRRARRLQVKCLTPSLRGDGA